MNTRLVRSGTLGERWLEAYLVWYGEHIRKLLAVPGVLESHLRFTCTVYREHPLP